MFGIPPPVRVQEQFGCHWLTGPCASIAALNARVMPTTMPEIRRVERDIPRTPEG
jgi:hypothetical protein